jgi:glycosyltransferase involved in cell wall biosynthesis
LTIKISIVLPVHNEFYNLYNLLSEWNKELNKVKSITYEFVLVEDGSTDGTKELIIKLEKIFPIINLSAKLKRGYSKAVLDGIRSATGDYILCTDSDNQIKAKSLIDNLNNLPRDNEFLIGIRSPRKDPTIRIVYSKLFKVLHNVLFKSKISDPSCPFVLGKKEEFKKLPESLLLKCKEGFWWAFTAVCIKFNVKIKETKIQHFERKYGNSGYSIKKIPLIATRNIIGLFLIKFLKKLPNN